MLKLSCRPLASTSYKGFLKNNGRSGTSLPASFFAWFLMKNISLIIFYYILTKFHFLVVFTLWDIGQYVYCNCFLPGCDVINFEINLIFLIKPFFLCDQKVKIKIWISWERKGLSLKKIKQIFLEAESPTWTLSWRRSLSCRNQCKSMDWFLYDRDLRHERVKKFLK